MMDGNYGAALINAYRQGDALHQERIKRAALAQLGPQIQAGDIQGALSTVAPYAPAAAVQGLQAYNENQRLQDVERQNMLRTQYWPTLAKAYGWVQSGDPDMMPDRLAMAQKVLAEQFPTEAENIYKITPQDLPRVGEMLNAMYANGALKKADLVKTYDPETGNETWATAGDAVGQQAPPSKGSARGPKLKTIIDSNGDRVTVREYEDGTLKRVSLDSTSSSFSEPDFAPWEGPTLMEQASEAFGVSESVQQIANNVAGQLPFGLDFEPAPKTAQARGDWRNFTRQLIRALALNSRYAVKEQEQISKLIGNPEAWQSPIVAMRNLDALKNDLENVMESYRLVLNDKNTPRKDRREVRAGLKSIKELHSRIGTMPEPEDGEMREIPSEAIEDLRNGVGTPEQFDEAFGPGAAEKVMNAR